MLLFLVPKVEPRHGTVGKVIMPDMGKGHVARPKIKICLQQREVATDHITILDPDHRNLATTGMDRLNLRRMHRKTNTVRIKLIGHPVDRIKLDQRIRLCPRVICLVACGLPDINNKESRIQPTFFHLRQIHLQAGALPRIMSCNPRISRRNINVTVERQQITMERRPPISMARRPFFRRLNQHTRQPDRKTDKSHSRYGREQFPAHENLLCKKLAR